MTHSFPTRRSSDLRDKGVGLVVIKLGADGAYFDSGDEQGYVAGVPVQTVVDTVGAGDGFAAGVISALLEGISLRPAVERGAWIGARAVQVLGDTEGQIGRASSRERVCRTCSSRGSPDH